MPIQTQYYQDFTEQGASGLHNTAWEQYGHTSVTDQSHQSFNEQSADESHALENQNQASLLDQSHQDFTELSASALHTAFWEQLDQLHMAHLSHQDFTDQDEQQATALPAGLGSLDSAFPPSMMLDQAAGNLQQPLGSTDWRLTESYAPSSTQTLQQTMQYGSNSPLTGYNSHVESSQPVSTVQDNNGLPRMETMMPNGVVVEPRRVRPGWRSYQLPSLLLITTSVPDSTSHTEFIQALRGDQERYQEWSRELEGFIRHSNALMSIRQFYWATSFVQNEGQLCFELIAPDTDYVRQWVEMAIENSDSEFSDGHFSRITSPGNRAQDQQSVVLQGQQYTAENYDRYLQDYSTTVMNEVSSTPSSPSTIGPASPSPVQCLNGDDYGA